MKSLIYKARRIGHPKARANSAFWTRYKDIAVLFTGAIFGVLTSVLAASQQAHFQRSQALSEKRFLVLRELVETNNDSWRKIDTNFEAGIRALEKLKKKAEQIDTAQSKMTESMNQFVIDLDALMDPISIAFDADVREYDAKVETLSTLIAYLSNQEPVKLKIDTDFNSHKARIDAISATLNSKISSSKDNQEIKIALKEFVEEFRKVAESIRDSLKSERTRVNFEIKKMAVSIINQ